MPPWSTTSGWSPTPWPEQTWPEPPRVRGRAIPGPGTDGGGSPRVQPADLSGRPGQRLRRARSAVVALPPEPQRRLVVLLQCVGHPADRPGDGEDDLSRVPGHLGRVGEGGERQVDVGLLP